MQYPKHYHYHKYPYAINYHFSKNQHNSSPQTSTSDHSESDRSQIQTKNIKVELCRNYVQKGYCPYETRCKFAHGVQQLRPKDPNCSQLYRTRKCKIFFEKHECKFGERCNFMHDSRKIEQLKLNNYKVKQAFRNNFFQMVFSNERSQSRLLHILKDETASLCLN